MSTEEQRLSPMVADTLVSLTLHVAALAVSAQHACLEVLEPYTEILYFKQVFAISVVKIDVNFRSTLKLYE